MYSVFDVILKEARIRASWAFICITATYLHCYFFSEELIFLLAKPFLFVHKHNLSFICTQLTETLNTYITTSLILCMSFCAPYLFYQSWCFIIPSCHQRQRAQLQRLCLFSGVMLVSMFYLTFAWIMPNLWQWLYDLSSTSTNQFQIQLQPRIYDFVMLTVRFLLISLVCSQMPVLVICLIEYHLISLRGCIKNRRIVIFCSVLIAALLTPPDIWCQLGALCPIYLVLELTIFLALIRAHYHISYSHQDDQIFSRRINEGAAI